MKKKKVLKLHFEFLAIHNGWVQNGGCGYQNSVVTKLPGSPALLLTSLYLSG